MIFRELAILEAVAAGCVAVVPDRLAYCELFDIQYRYASQVDDIKKQANHLCDLYQKFHRDDFCFSPDVSRFSWINKKDDYVNLFNKVVGGY